MHRGECYEHAYISDNTAGFFKGGDCVCFIKKWIWCCMCKQGGQSLDHLLILFKAAKDLWALIFCTFLIASVMPQLMVDLMAYWGSPISGHSNFDA